MGACTCTCLSLSPNHIVTLSGNYASVSKIAPQLLAPRPLAGAEWLKEATGKGPLLWVSLQ